MTLTFERLSEDGVLGPIHRAFGELLKRLEPDLHPHVQLAGAITSEQLARGHVCLDLKAAEHITFAGDDSGENVRTYRNWPKLSNWAKELQKSALVGAFASADSVERLEQPLVFEAEQQRVYLARYWFFQQQLAEWIADRMKRPPLPLDRRQLVIDVERLFPHRDEASDRDQFAAVLNAADRRFAVVTGGPGTGKTTTVAKLLAARLLQASGASAGPRIMLMAPTGKAAQRLNESLTRAASNLPKGSVTDSVCEQLKAVTAGTIHRLLEWTPLPPERGGPFRKGQQQPLDADVVLVDEASMVDIELMWHLFAALRPETQIILMGDRDQLASVEAGGVLSDLCGEPTLLPTPSAQSATDGTQPKVDASTMAISTSKPTKSPKRAAVTKSLFSDEEVAAASEAPLRKKAASASTAVESTSDDSLSAAVSWLRFSHRFSSESEFGRLAAAIRAGDADRVIALLRASQAGDIVWISTEHSEVAQRQVVEKAAERYRGYLDELHAIQNTSADSTRWSNVLKQLASVRVLCAHRDGNSGERAMNQRLVQFFTNQNWLRPRVGSYLGQAVIITENDYRQNLFNGDVGVVVPAALGVALAFEDASGTNNSVRLIPSALAPAHRDSWAMTIHKSQGSEFRSVFVVLPEFESPVLSRELLYTAVTRVKDSRNSNTGEGERGFLCLAAREDVLRAAITRGIRRTSGLRDAINARIKAEKSK